jgi:hypothetical protein
MLLPDGTILLPDGIDDFDEIRTTGYPYADKTKFIYQMILEKKQYFLSRPRRFGKSLLISTFEALFKGRRNLFEGLWIADSDYNFIEYPVICLRFGDLVSSSLEDMYEDLGDMLTAIADSYDVKTSGKNPVTKFRSLIRALKIDDDKKNGGNGKNDANKGVVVLIDEYDAPILDNITDDRLAKKIRNGLAKFYAVLKSQSENLRFVFITGVTKFTLTSLFSGANHLIDLTLDDRYANICGFTVDEFDSLFKETLEKSLKFFRKNKAIGRRGTPDTLRELFLTWYDGYSWDGITGVLNPWSVLKCISMKKFTNSWFKSGTPSFLFRLLEQKKIDLYSLTYDKKISDDINAIDVDDVDTVSLMFQTGYLTIKREPPSELDSDELDSDELYFDELESGQSNMLHLCLPNLEVKSSLISRLLSLENPFRAPVSLYRHGKALLEGFRNHSEKEVEASFHSFLSILPTNVLLPFEASYQGWLLMALGFADQSVIAEEVAADGRLDVHFLTKDNEEFIVELKFIPKKKKTKNEEEEEKRTGETPRMTPEENAAETARIEEKTAEAVEAAMSQIEYKNYTSKFQGTGRKIWKVALVVRYRTDVRVVFREAANWRLVRGDDEKYWVEFAAGQ